MSISAVIAASAAVLIMMNCGKSRSAIVKEVPKPCAMILEGDYFTDGESQVYTGVFGESCKAALAYEFCEDAKRSNKLDLCLAKFGK